MKSPYKYKTYLDDITDQEIRQARCFEGHTPSYMEWDKSVWFDAARGIPDRDREHNAYHVSFLADKLLASGSWIGEPLSLWTFDDNVVFNGNHRYRALKLLWNECGFTVDVPVNEKCYCLPTI
jgi:hypothetical protein